jgi:hypothetical protein
VQFSICTIVSSSLFHSLFSVIKHSLLLLSLYILAQLVAPFCHPLFHLIVVFVTLSRNSTSSLVPFRYNVHISHSHA